MRANHVDVLAKVVAAAGGQRALAAKLTAHIQLLSPATRAVSQQRVYKWLAGSAIDPAICHSIVGVAAELKVDCSLAQLHTDAALIWPQENQPAGVTPDAGGLCVASESANP